MKARIKATGEIIEVYFYGKEGYDYVCNDKEECYERGELEILDEPDYWTRLEHQYAGLAMLVILADNDLLMSLINKKADDYPVKYTVAEFAKDCAHALAEKYKKEEGK